MERYINLNHQLLKVSFVSQLKNGRFLIGFWINQGTADQDFLTISVDKLIKTTSESKEIYDVISDIKPDLLVQR